MPHWACHYYSLETDSSFVVGKWQFSRSENVVSLVIYSGLILMNLICVIVALPRVMAARITGVAHLAIGAVHALRLVRPFRFELFDHRWPIAASAREVAIVGVFGLLSLLVADSLRRDAS